MSARQLPRRSPDTPTYDLPLLLSVPQAAVFAHRSEWTMREWYRTERIRGVRAQRVGSSKILIHRDSLLRALGLLEPAEAV